jgi:hypothetical protein
MTLLVRRKGKGEAGWEVTNSSQRRILKIEVAVVIVPGEGCWKCKQEDFSLETEGQSPDEAVRKMKEALLRGDACKAEPEFASKLSEEEVEPEVVEAPPKKKSKGVLREAIASLNPEEAE